MKIASIPDTEPLYKTMQSRVINIASIKDKQEKKYWQKLKQENKIPDIYLPIEYLNSKIRNQIKEGEKINDKGSR